MYKTGIKVKNASNFGANYGGRAVDNYNSKPIQDLLKDSKRCDGILSKVNEFMKEEKRANVKEEEEDMIYEDIVDRSSPPPHNDP